MVTQCITSAPTNGTEAFEKLHAKMQGKDRLQVGNFIINKVEDSWGDVTYKVEEASRAQTGTGPIFVIAKIFHLLSSNEFTFQRLSGEGDYVTYGLTTDTEELAQLTNSLDDQITENSGVLFGDVEFSMFAAAFDLSIQTTCK